MYGVTLLIAASAIGVDYGWQPAGNGSLEYIIQIEPELIPLLEAGEAITSEIPSHLAGVRRFRIQIGDGDLPQEESETVADSRADPTSTVPDLDSPFRPHVPSAEADESPGDSSTESVLSEGNPDESTPVENVPSESIPAEAEGDGPAPADADGFPDSPRPLDPPREEGGNLFSGNLFPGDADPSGSELRGPELSDPVPSDTFAGGSTAPPTPIEPPAVPPSLEIPLLDPPGEPFVVDPPGELLVVDPPGEPLVADPPGEPLVADTTEELADEPLFAQPELTKPGLLTPEEPAGSLAEFQENVSADGEAAAETSSPETTSAQPRAETAPSSTSAPAAASRPWLPLILTLLLLFASIGGNVYLGWILLETLARYRRLRSEVAAA